MKRKVVRPEKFEHVGEWIRFNRERARYSLRMFADEFGKSHSWVAKIESGDAPATAEVVATVAELTGADPNEGLLLLAEKEIAGKDVLDYLPPRERELIRAYRDNQAFKVGVDLMLGNLPSDPVQATPVDEAEKARRERIRRDEAEDDSRRALEARDEERYEKGRIYDR